MEKRIQESETRMCRAVFPNTLNANNTLFGGLAMKWMDEVAYITATRFAKQKMFTVNTENVHFLKPVSPDSIVEVVGKVENVGPVKLRIKVEIYAEQMYGQQKDKVVETVFVFAALDDKLRPKRMVLNEVSSN